MNPTTAHATALRLVKKHGFKLTFSRRAPSTEDANGQSVLGALTTIVGYAVQDDTGGDPAAFQSLKLTQSSAMRVYFTPETINTCGEVGDDCSLESRVVKSSEPYRMGANAEIIGAYMVLV